MTADAATSPTTTGETGPTTDRDPGRDRDRHCGREADETAVPDGDSPPRCARCGRPFPDADLLTLHRGLAHYDDLSDDERAAFEAAYRDETADLRLFRLQALAALVVLYFGFLFAYSAFG